MYRAYLDDLLRFLDGVATLRSVNDDKANDFDEHRGQIESYLKQIGGFAIELELESTPSRIEFAIRDIKTMSQAEFTEALKQIDRHIRRDVVIVALSVVPKAKRGFYAPKFCDDVSAKFPRAALELREGGACFALGRNTGAVFHAVRAAEWGVRALAKAAGVRGDINFKEWGKVIRSIEEKVNAIDKWHNGRQKSNALEFFRDGITYARGVKDDHRNVWLHLREDRSLASEGEALKALERARDLLLLCQTRISEDQKRPLAKRVFAKDVSSVARTGP